jgi:hypothetical protein
MKSAVKSLFLPFVLATTLAHAQTFPTPIQHVIIVVQENRTPDNLFQDPNLMNNGADISRFSDAVAVPLGSCWDIGHSHGTTTTTGWEREYADQQSGQGFCNDKISVNNCKSYPTCAPDTYVENTSQDKTIQPYWDIAENYSFANYFFQTNEGPSFPAHQFLLSGTSAPVSFGDPSGLYEDFDAENTAGMKAGYDFFDDAGCIATTSPLATAEDVNSAGTEGLYYTPPAPINYPGYPCYEHHTLTDLLENAKPALSWRWYAYSRPAGIWNAPSAISHICGVNPGGTCPNADWNDNVDLTDTDIFLDVNDINTHGRCNLANVSWVIPDGNWSDHPGGMNHGGPDWVTSIVNAVGNSPCKNSDGSSYWESTAIIITWDDWGGFYDHVPPYEVIVDQPGTFGSGYVAGFRVPLLVVSAYSPKKGYISGPCVPSTDGINNGDVCLNNKPPYWHDAGSILNFTEYVMGLPQGGISQTPSWNYDDFWAPDYWANGSCGRNQQLCPFGLSDFFNFKQSPNSFTNIAPITYQPSDFVGLSGFGGPSNTQDPDLETE